MTPCVVKVFAGGSTLRRKFRVTVADARDRPGSLFDAETFSAAIDGQTVRFLDSITLGRGGTRRNLDVKGAYFEGRKIPPEEDGGCSLWAPVPAAWDEFGYQQFDGNGARNWFEITGNVPGLRDAGRVWAADCDAFLLGEGFVQSIVDRRVFIRQLSPTPGDKLFVVGVYVDDYWTYCEDDAVWEDFYAKWSSRYTASATVAQAGSDFCGISYTSTPDGGLALGCLKLLGGMDVLLEGYVSAASYDTPMASDALSRIRDPVSDANPLVDQVPKARAILGLGLFITRNVRTDALFPALALSQYIVNHLTKAVWEALLRWANYLIQTRDMTLILRPLSRRPEFSACSDSSLINAPVSSVAMPDVAAASYGGFALFFPGSGAFAVECLSPRRLADSSAGSELIMATWAGKSIIAFQMLQNELGMGRTAPTPLELDASAVTQGALMEKVSRQQRFAAARLAMLRQWLADRTLVLMKTSTKDMRADILSKPVNPGDDFRHKQRLLLTGCASSDPAAAPATPPRAEQ